jgi:Cytochrome c7 and related cytochrome c
MTSTWGTTVRVAGAVLLVGCALAEPRAVETHAAETVTIGLADSAATIRNATLEPGALGTVVAAPVAQPPAPNRRPFEVALRSAEPRSGHARRFGTITLPTSLRRVPALTQYPCTSCHLGSRLVMADKRVIDAHQNIQPVHPKATGAVCSTCHSADNVELLALKSGERPALDHAYRLCAQCHFAQAEAWAGGGHGKRLDGWQGRRVVMGCSDCHNPHSPTVEARIPFRAPQLQPRRGEAK